MQVKDKKEFEFDPANTVLEICRIYINLEKSDAFCLAVSQEGRSYSPQLFDFAEQVLSKVFFSFRYYSKIHFRFFSSSYWWWTINWRN